MTELASLLSVLHAPAEQMLPAQLFGFPAEGRVFQLLHCIGSELCFPLFGREFFAPAHERDTMARDPERGGYRFNGWTLERRGRKLLDANGSPVALSKGEYALLLAFLEAPQRPLTREHLLQATRVHEDIFDRSIDVQVLRLRRKLETDPSAPRIIQTERGVGYVFALPVESF